MASRACAHVESITITRSLTHHLFLFLPRLLSLTLPQRPVTALSHALVLHLVVNEATSAYMRAKGVIERPRYPHARKPGTLPPISNNVPIDVHPLHAPAFTTGCPNLARPVHPPIYPRQASTVAANGRPHRIMRTSKLASPRPSLGAMASYTPSSSPRLARRSRVWYDACLAPSNTGLCPPRFAALLMCPVERGMSCRGVGASMCVPTSRAVHAMRDPRYGGR
jgi:hypothetical protein